MNISSDTAENEYAMKRDFPGLSRPSVIEQEIEEFLAAGIVKPVTVLEEAEQIINGEREEAYGDYRKMHGKIAAVWGVILNAKVTPEQVALMMIGLKLCREANSHKRDNLVDLAGYTAILAKLTGD